jgi:hypothetical protein
MRRIKLASAERRRRRRHAAAVLKEIAIGLEVSVTRPIKLNIGHLCYRVEGDNTKISP